jgi:hypothetical protein
LDLHGFVIAGVASNHGIQGQATLLRQKVCHSALGKKQDQLPYVVSFWEIDALPREKGFEISLHAILRAGAFFEEVYERVPGQLSRDQLGLIALRYFEQLGHNSQRRIFKFFAWEAAKTKASSTLRLVSHFGVQHGPI